MKRIILSIFVIVVTSTLLSAQRNKGTNNNHNNNKTTTTTTTTTTVTTTTVNTDELNTQGSYMPNNQYMPNQSDNYRGHRNNDNSQYHNNNRYNNNNNNYVVTQEPVVEAVPVVVYNSLNEDAFDNILKELKKIKFESDREPYLSNLAQTYNFTTRQVKYILEALSFEDTKLKFAKESYPYLIDVENFSQVIDLFKYSGSKEELRKLMN